MFLNLLWLITAITCLFCVLYMALIASHCYGWIRTKTVHIETKENISVSIIIAARNEEKNIGKCLDALIAQEYDRSKLRIIIVDDHSTDGTSAIIADYVSLHDFIHSIKLNEGLSGKKKAIAEGIASSVSELIITTDADCTMGKHWLQNMVSFYVRSGAKMVAGPVAFSGERSIFEKMQSLELMALIGSTGGSLYFNRPILCNGANLAYSRSGFNEINGFEGIDVSASGDDVLLMYKMAKAYPGAVRFLKAADAVVYTGAKKRIQDFVNQRKRWASKGFAALNAETKAASVIVYGFCFFLLLMGIITAFASIKSTVYQPFLQICLILTGFKCIIDFLLLFLAASFFRKRGQLLLFLPEQLLYIFYVVTIGLIGGMKKYSWKGRSY